MEKTLAIWGLCCLAVALGSPIFSEPPDVEIDDIYRINEIERKVTERQNRVAPNCPSEESCMKSCPLGHVKDELGCPICNLCKEEGSFESDIAVNKKSYKQLLRQFGADESCEADKLNRGAMSNKDQEWPKEGDQVIVPYIFSESVSESKRNNIRNGISLYHANTCIRFVQRTSQTNYIEFVGTGGCQSYVGMIGGPQKVWIGNGCDNKIGTILHELMHALGFWHEQSRGDRDSYVNIHWENIIDGFTGNFEKQSTSVWNSYGSAYDLGSVMHYGGYFFSKDRNSPTITDKAGTPVVSQRERFTEEDLKQINNKYQCSGTISNTQPVTTTTTTTTLAPGTCADLVSKGTCDWYKANNYCATSTQVRQQCRLTCGLCTAATTAPPTTTTRPTTTRRPTTTTTTTAATTTKTITGNGICGDNSQYCPQWKNSGHCTDNFKAYMTTNCKLSCGLCVSTTPPTTTQPAVTNPAGTKKCFDLYKLSSCQHWESAGYCQTKHVTFMKTNCNATCALCTGQGVTTTQAPACTNLHGSCTKWAEYGYCSKNYVSYMAKNCRKACGLCNGGVTTTPTTTTPSANAGPVRYYGNCGIPDQALNYRIVGGKEAIYKSSPWMVSIRQANGQDLCGGVLISNRFMLTAAHCFGGTKNPTESLYYAFLGKYHVSANIHDAGQKKVFFKHITIHPAYNHGNSDNDIAVIEFTESVTFTDYIRPICLPPGYQEPLPGTVALVSGWGETKSATQSNDVMLQVDVQIIDKGTCNVWMKAQSGISGEVTDNMFCAGHQTGGKDACQGDSGGPLVQQERGVHYLKGLVSWGYGCARVERPGVYTKVSSKVDWINGIMEA